LEFCFSIPLQTMFASMFKQIPHITGQSQIKVVPMIIDWVLANGFAGVYDATRADCAPSVAMIEWAFDILEDWLEMDDDDRKLWKFVKYYFINTPLLMPDGWIWKKKGKVPSGSGFTQMMQSILNTYVVTNGLYRSRGIWPQPKTIFCVGDDVLFRVGDSYDPSFQEDFAREVTRMGYETNAAKVQYSNEPHKLKFLGRSSKGGSSFREWEELSKVLVFPEHFKHTFEHSFQKVNGLIIDSAYCSPKLLEIYRIYMGIDMLTEMPSLSNSQLRYFQYVLKVDPSVANQTISAPLVMGLL